MRNVPTDTHRYAEGMRLLGLHAGLLVVGVLIQYFLATQFSQGVFAASYGFVLVYAYVVATTIGYGALAVRARNKPLGVRFRYLVMYHFAATVLMIFILLLLLYNPVVRLPRAGAPTTP
jgi:L-asparagine transporter-like permease